MQTKTYHVEGMTCGGCVASLTRALEVALPGLRIEVKLEGGEVRVEEPHDVAKVAAAVADAGYTWVGAA